MILRSFTPQDGEHIAGLWPDLVRDVTGVWQRRPRLFSGRNLTAAAFDIEQTGRGGREATTNQLVSWGVVDGLQAAITVAGVAPNVTRFLEITAGIGIAAGGEEVTLQNPVRIPLASIPGLDTPGAKFGTIVLEPVEAKVLGTVLPTDECEFDETTDAFSDWQLIDGCRIAFVPWPIAELGAFPTGATARNRAAYIIYDKERSFTPDQAFSWEEAGLPIGLLFNDPAGSFFIDRYSVVRNGGRPRRRTSPIPGTGHHLLWQARLLQFSEHILQMNLDTAVPPANTTFAFFPPAGLLPRQFFGMSFDNTTGLNLQQNYFPIQFQLQVAPIPLEQLDAAIVASASFAPLDLSVREWIELLVPVPQVYFEPNLLKAEQVDPRFQDAIDEAISRRADALGRRQIVRANLVRATQFLTGKTLVFPASDPNQVDVQEAVNPNPPADPLDTPANVGQIMDDHIQAMAKILGAIYSDPNKAGTVAKSLNVVGLIPLAEQLDRLADRADDLINAGFIRVQVDQYRLRNILLGSTATSRLAISPAIAGVAEASTAIAQEQAINQALSDLKASKGPDVVNRVFKPVRIPTNADFQFAIKPPPPPPQPPGPSAEQPALLSNAPSAVVTFGASQLTSRFTRATTPVTPARTRVTFPARSTKIEAGAPVKRFLNGGADIPLLIDKVVGRRPPGEVAKEPPSTPIEVIVQPVQGRVDIRSTTTEQRIQPAKGPQARDYALATKFTVVSSLKNTPLAILDPRDQKTVLTSLSDVFANVLVPGMGIWQLVNNLFTWVFTKDAAGVSHNLSRQNVLLSTLDQNAINLILQEPDDQGILDESHYFFATVDIIETTTGALRSAEAFVEPLRQAADECRKAGQLLADAITVFQQRLGTIEDMIAEGRQDIAVGRALLADEQQRVLLINQRRARVLNEQVPVLCFRRTPVMDAPVEVPTRDVDPNVPPTAVPGCLAQNLTPPPELQKLVDIIREAPVMWFPNIEKFLPRLDRPIHLRDAVRHAQARVAGKVSAVLDDPDFLTVSNGRFTTALTSVLSAQRNVSRQYRSLVPQIDPAVIYNLAWRDAYRQVRQVLSIGDLIDGVGGRSDLSRLAGQQLDQIARVSACLHEKITELLPAVRLEWALRFSQYDTSVDFSNLSLMPRWTDIDFLDRHDLQTFVDWLFGQIDRTDANATATIDNIVRVVILLASHAPVNRLIQGAIDQAADVREGEFATVTFDPIVIDYVHRGMNLQLVRAGAIIANAVVDDMLGVRVQINVTRNLTSETVLKLDPSIKVQSVNNSNGTRVVRTLVQGSGSRTTALIAAATR